MSGPGAERDAPLETDAARRVWIENVRPRVDDGAFPIKRTVGERVVVTADGFTDGHDRLGVALRWRAASEAEWHEVPMQARPNDVWQAEFPIARLERHVYTVAGWVDPFAGWRDGLAKKHEAGQDVASELLEGAALIREAAARAAGPDATWLRDMAAALESAATPSRRVERALAEDLRVQMARWPDRSRETVHERCYAVDVNRERARAGAWYEMFPRSSRPDGRHGTLRDAETRLPDIARMGFDVLYLPPIHPIGRSYRKGPNNTLDAGPDDPGSPWAIGAAEGGHTAVHPELGTLEDFDRFRAACERHGLELALDLAFQCSPDHPWVRAHPEWFRHRPDGTIKYAENPPKKYQDIYPLDFDSEDWRGLWQALLEVTRFWCARGVGIFRVDNPHTKPFRFWRWLIAEIKREYPETVFLSEAFTRPKVMYALAKLGFDQSYTYFTWRNTKPELEEYLTELTRTDVREFFRPNLFANTPDILPEYLQYGGRPAFMARLVLAATVGASYGIYSGFELAENAARPGSEEYQDSEKYEIRRREWDQRGTLHDYIARVNAIRREQPALRTNEWLTFHAVDNEQLLCYSKRTADRADVMVMVVNLDPHHPHDGWVELPLAALGIDPEETYQMHDLLGGGRYLWHGARNYVRLDPAQSPAQVFRLRRRVRTERDFDYFM
ncbi:MAG: alpha-1,4-glucan--maltose-1-phosphate maltosyltransferase [Gemmatimonadota bacterium]|nr:alpha-1,4-glucan--maltose-1-phosphate maltosyltransferase [Gemmatimonadota bacterium]